MGADRIMAWDYVIFVASFRGTQVKAAFLGLLLAGAPETQARVPGKDLPCTLQHTGCHRDLGGLRGQHLWRAEVGGGLVRFPCQCPAAVCVTPRRGQGSEGPVPLWDSRA